jgi:hypothetical protein
VADARRPRLGLVGHQRSSDPARAQGELSAQGLALEPRRCDCGSKTVYIPRLRVAWQFLNPRSSSHLDMT